MSARGLSSASAAVIALSLYSTLAMAQSRGTINGTVKDSTGDVVFVEVSIVGSNATVTTDEQGRFRFTGVPFGTVELRARRIGYTPTTQTLMFSKASEAAVELVMSAAPGYLPSVEVHEPRQVYDSRLQGFNCL